MFGSNTTSGDKTLADAMRRAVKESEQPQEAILFRALGWLVSKGMTGLHEHLIPRVPRTAWIVLAGGGGLLLGGDALHKASPDAWPMAVLIGAGAGALFAYRYAGRARWVAAGCATGAGVLLAAVWAAGTVRGLVVLVAICAIAGALWEFVRNRRARPVRKESEPDPARIVAEWETIAKAAKVPSTRARLHKRDETGFTLLVYMDRGRVPAELVGNLEQLESALDDLGVRTGSLTVTRDPEHASWAYLRVVVRDPLSKLPAWPGPTATNIVGAHIVLGRYVDGQEATLTLLPEPGQGAYLLVAGVKGSGKSGALHLVVGNLAHMHDVALWGIDLKRVEMSKWDKCFDRLALDPDSAEALLKAAVRVMKARTHVMQDQGLRTWVPSPEMPLLVIVVDELGTLDDRCTRLLSQLATVGRAQGIQLILATQRPSKEDLGDKGMTLRSQCDAVIAMRVGRPEDTNIILGQGKLGDGWRPDRLRGKGEFLISSEEKEHEQPRRARAYHVTDKLLDRWAAECATTRPTLDEASASAAAEGA